MFTKRFFVTAVAFFGTLWALAACHRSSDNAPNTTEWVKEGQDQLKRADKIELELASVGVLIGEQNQMSMNGTLVPQERIVRDTNWRRFSRDQRVVIKQKLLKYVSIASSILEIDARKGVYLTQKALITSKRDNAFKMVKEIENAERMYGENWNPKPDPSAPPLIPNHDI